MAKRQYTDSCFVKAIQTSKSVADVLRKIGLKITGSNYKTVKMLARKFNVDTSHFTGKGHLIGKRHNWARKMPMQDILVEDSNYSCSNSLKKRLIKEGLLKEICVGCGQEPYWNGNKLVLTLDHKNGNNTDNRIENLRLLCPNCHSQTLTFAGKNRKSEKKIGLRRKKISICSGEQLPAVSRKCLICGKPVKKWNLKYCSYECSEIAQRKVPRPSKEQLLEDVSKMSMLAVGKKYGVSDNAIRKWLKKTEI